MSTYAIGDIQGCFATLRALLARIAFDPQRDRLWLVGDLVNRGPRSLEVLRWARALGDRAAIVLGNHDLHLLARALGVGRPRRRDTLDEVLAAPDLGVLVGWLRGMPLLHREGDRVLVHAGLATGWTIADAEAAAREVEAELSGEEARAARLLQEIESGAWREGRDGGRIRRVRSLALLTRLRTLRPEDGEPCWDYSGPPDEAPEGCVPWFAAPGRKSAAATVVFGHWAALGLVLEPRVVALDTGCVWGGRLTAVRLEDRAVFQEPSREGAAGAED